MRIALLARTIPTNGIGGPQLSMWALAHGLKEEGHEVWFLPFASTTSGATGLLDELIRSGIHVAARAIAIAESCEAKADRDLVAVAGRLANLEKRFYPLKTAEHEVKQLLLDLQPDLVVAYETAVSTTLQDISMPVITCLVDLDHLPQAMRLQSFSRRFAKTSARRRFQVAARSRLLEQVMLRVLRRSDLVINFAAHHAAWLRGRGINCCYLQTPIPDCARPSKVETNRSPVKRILLLGHLRGTATLTGLDYLSEEVLPYMTPKLATAPCEIRVAGAHTDSLPRQLRGSLETFGVQLLGFVPDIDEEIDKASVILVPTPIDLGTRVRILVGFSHGRCVIAHAANARGIPEIHNRVNCLTGQSGRELAELTLEALSDMHLRQTLEASARQTYCQHFAPRVVAKKFSALADAVLNAKTGPLLRTGDGS